MKRRDPPPVPPLADTSVSRVERGVFAALDRDPAGQGALPLVIHRWRWPVVVGATALAVLATWGAHALWRAPGLPAHGARIATATSPSHLTVEGAAIDVAPSSAVTFADEGEGSTVIRLERGSVTCEVAPRDTRAPFVVEAGTTRVTVVGTRFAVTRVGDRAQVWVVHGTVQVDDDGVTQLVHAGERYLPGATPGAVAQEEAPVQKSETAVSDSPPPDVAPVITREIAREPVRVVTPWRERSETRLAVSTSLAAQSAPLVHPPGERMVAVARTADAPPPAEITRVQDAHSPVITSAALRERFESAVALEVRDPLAAFRIYRELANGTGPWAANALFAEGRLSAERGQGDAAYALLSSYLERFPEGPNADDARALLARLKGADGLLR